MSERTLVLGLVLALLLPAIPLWRGEASGRDQCGDVADAIERVSRSVDQLTQELKKLRDQQSSCYRAGH